MDFYQSQSGLGRKMKKLHAFLKADGLHCNLSPLSGDEGARLEGILQLKARCLQLDKIDSQSQGACQRLEFYIRATISICGLWIIISAMK